MRTGRARGWAVYQCGNEMSEGNDKVAERRVKRQTSEVRGWLMEIEENARANGSSGQRRSEISGWCKGRAASRGVALL